MLIKKFLPFLLISIPCLADNLPNLTPAQNMKLQDNLIMLELNKAAPSIEKELPIYENLIELTCMPNLYTTLDYSGYDPETPEGKECAKYIDKLDALMPADPVLLCAKNGLSASICKEGYDAQYIGTFNPDEYDEETINLKAKINMEMSETEIKKLKEAIEENLDSLKSIDEKISKIEEKFPNEKQKIEDLKKEKNTKSSEIEDQYIKLVNLQCSLVRISVVSDKAPDDSMLIKQQSSKKTGSKLEKLIFSLQDNKQKNENTRKAETEDQNLLLDPFERKALGIKIQPTAAPTPAKNFWRIRSITSKCSSAIEDALKFSPYVYSATCKKYGESSPHCINSIKQFRLRRMKTVSPTAVIKRVDGLATF